MQYGYREKKINLYLIKSAEDFLNDISYKEIIIPKESKIKTFHYRYPSKN